MLLAYSWPGNVRELDNVMQRAIILSDGENIEKSALILEDMQFESICDEPETVIVSKVEKVAVDKNNSTVHSAHSDEAIDNEVAGLGKGLKEQEQKIILDALQTCAGKRKDVAELLGISPRTLRYKIARMREQGIILTA